MSNIIQPKPARPPNSWLYPISERAGREFLLEKGTRLKVSVDNYAKLVKNGRLCEDEVWYVTTNFRVACPDEEVFIYTGDQNLGIIGYARILKVEHRKNDHVFHLQFDLKKCKKLLNAPIPALEVRKWIRGRIRAVNNIKSHLAKLNTLLPWKRENQPEEVETPLFGPTRSGAVFGDFEQNKKIEKAAIRAATDYYRKQGWKVVSVENQKPGYDLLCSKSSQTKKVEVKGIAGDRVCFILTAGERRAARYKDFVLCVVRKALSKQPVITNWTGQQMEKNFTFEGMNYLTSLKN